MIIVVVSTLEHVDDIHEIEQESFSLPWSKYSLRGLISDKHSVCLSAVLTEGGSTEKSKIIGHASMMHVINEGHIYNVAVASAYRKQRIGTLLLERLIDEARSREMIGLTLEVRASNVPAINLYKKFGFVNEGIRKRYYHFPSEDGIVMWRYL